MLENMDYDSQQYEDTPYRSIARQMSYLTTTDFLVAPGMLKVKKKHDAHCISKYRKGAEKCTTTGSRKKPIYVPFVKETDVIFQSTQQ